MWKRHLLFAGLCLAGLGLVSASLFSRNRLPAPRSHAAPRDFDPDFAAVVAQVDGEFADHWRQRQLTPAPAAPPLAVARRLSLALTGTIPSLEEIRAFEARGADEQAAWWTAYLLEDRRYADYVAERLARAYVGADNGPFLVFRRRRFVHWLSDWLHDKNSPGYDELARRLLGEEGLWTNTPAVNFATACSDPNNDNQPDPIRLAGRASRVFLGMRIDCLQCHDDNLGHVDLALEGPKRDGLQRDFHQLAAFFAQTKVNLLGVKDRPGEHVTRYLDAAEDTTVPPIPPFLEDLAPVEGSRRQRFAEWVTHPDNKAFARAAVNRAWALMFGKPLVAPIDDIPLRGPFPPGLETLAADFTRHGHDLRRLFRLIAATRAYQLDSRADFELTAEHERHWASFPVTRLRPEQVAGSIIQAGSLTTINGQAHILTQLARFGQETDFVRRYGDRGEDEFTDRGGTIPQRLLLMNGDLVRDKTNNEPLFNAAAQLAILAPSDSRAVETAFLAVLTRRPAPAEIAHFEALLAGLRDQERAEQMEDVYWALLNCAEFAWNH